ncbi:uncharacterized protein LOC121862214 [Homarus americanus]|uniref:PKD domain-containing protein n=1 Tax=Homarus americanus TaxID=6706 RepID=A0A8J5N2U7_HOMAM|nr:uncharacterized protein LOC121862214 [Homarus americanus]KAG7172318.1 hypothetical protein Hamer_G009683 [Homarus americanus]
MLVTVLCWWMLVTAVVASDLPVDEAFEYYDEELIIQNKYVTEVMKAATVEVTVDPHPGRIGEPVSVKIKINNAEHAGVVMYRIDFGDGSSKVRGVLDDSKKVKRSHRYSAKGSYTIEAKVLGLGTPRTRKRTVNITKPPRPDSHDDSVQDNKEKNGLYIGLLVLAALLLVICLVLVGLVHGTTVAIMNAR